MPFYNYECSECGHEVEQFRTIAQYDMPCKEACLSCFKIGYIARLISGASALCDSVLLESTKGLLKPTSEFNERLRAVKKAHAGSTIEVRD